MRIVLLNLVAPILMSTCGCFPAVVLMDDAYWVSPGVVVGLTLMVAIAASMNFQDISIIAHRIAWWRGPQYGFTHETPRDPIFWLLLVAFILLDFGLLFIYAAVILRNIL